MACKQCHQDQIDNKVPPLRIILQEFPCPVHGHPGRLSLTSMAWVDFYQVIAPYSREGALDHVLIDKICQAEGIDFLTAFEWLTFISQNIPEETDGNEGIHESRKQDESQGGGD